jgi:hypothetical protein
MPEEPTLLIVTPDTLLPALGLTDLEGEFASAAAKTELFELFIMAYKDYIESGQAYDPETVDNGRLPFRIPGTPIVIRLDGLQKEDVKAFITFAILLTASGHLSLKEFPVAAVLAAFSRFRKLRADIGELSVYEIVRKHQPATIASIVGQMYGKPCRHLRADCRYLSTASSTCGINIAATQDVVRALAARHVLEVWNPGASQEQYQVRV